MKSHRKLLIIGAIALAYFLPLSALAVNSTPAKTKTSSTAATSTSTTAAKTAATKKTTDKVADLKSRANKEIDRRLASLNKLSAKITALQKLTAEQKTALATQVQANITDLTNLKAKIGADTDLATLQTDVKSIVGSYRIYALFMPKVYILSSVDIINEAADSFTVLATKLSTRLDQASVAGTDVTALRTALTDMQNKIADAKAKALEAQNAVISLVPDGYPGNKPTLQSARSSIKTARADLTTAKQDANTIITGLKAINTGATTGSAPAASPTTPK